MSKALLTVELDPVLIERVQRYSEEHGKEVSETVSEMIQKLPMEQGGENGGTRHAAFPENGSPPEVDDAWERNLPPITRSLLGIASGGSDEEDYREYLWRKYGS